MVEIWICSPLLSSPQMSYSLTRFAIYETVRDMMGSQNQRPMPFYQKVLLGAFGGGRTQMVCLYLLFFSLTDCHTCAHTHAHLQKHAFFLFFNRVHWWVCWHASWHGKCQVTFYVYSCIHTTVYKTYYFCLINSKNCYKNCNKTVCVYPRMQNDMKLPPEHRRKWVLFVMK